MNRRYHIMTSCDDRLVPYLAVGLTAMALNIKDADIDFFLFHTRVSQKNIEMLKTLCAKLENGKIHFHEILVPHAEVYSELAEYGNGWAGYFYLWHEYAIITNDVLEKMGY